MENPKPTVLVVEDDTAIADLVEIHLKDLGFEVVKAETGGKALQFFSDRDVDLVILDLMLPDMDGLEICRNIRNTGSELPVIMLTAKSEEIDKVLGLEIGADDYITKPFSIREFQARVKAVMRRSDKGAKTDNKDEKLHFGELVIDTLNRIVLLRGERMELTPKEYDLLVLLARHPGRSYSRAQLLNLVWGYQFDGYEHTVNSHINRLRTKIEDEASRPRYILTTWGVGYRFNDSLS